MCLQVGQSAPHFEMDAVLGSEFIKVNLSEYHGKWLILFFHPLAFTGICASEIKGFNDRYEDFQQAGAIVLGGSIDSKFTHKAWIEHELGTLKYPLFSDLTKEVSRAYGVLKEDLGADLRGLFIIDPEGIIRYQVVHDLSIGRSVDETYRVLMALQSGEACPVNWKPK
jgi:alkyl hydroperoxide reductase subunit AhpC